MCHYLMHIHFITDLFWQINFFYLLDTSCLLFGSMLLGVLADVVAHLHISVVF